MNDDIPSVRVKRISALSPRTEALYEVGKKMLSDSIEIGREFSKFMITVASSAVPIYLALLGLLGIKESKSLLFFAPPGLLLLSVVFFVLAYFPKYGEYSLEIVEEIEAAREKAILGRNLFLYSGLATFLFAVALSAVIILQARLHAEPAEYQVEVTTEEIPKSATAKDIDTRLIAFEQKLNRTKGLQFIDVKKFESTQSTVIVAIVQYKTK